MRTDIKKLYDQASTLGLNPFMFDTQVSKYDVFDRKNNRITKLNHVKYMNAATKILKEIQK